MPEKRVTISDIAARAEVHPSTVSLALRNDPRIPHSTRQRIQGIAVEIGYRPNLMARGLKGQATNTVGLLTPKLRDHFFATVVSHEEESLRARNITPILSITKADEQLELSVIEELVSRGVDGFIVNYELTSLSVRKRIAQVVRTGTAVTMLGAPGIEGVDCVFYDTTDMGYEITDHLLSLGHTRIAVLTWSLRRRRIEGYRRALAEAGMPFEPEWVFVRDESSADMTRIVQKMMALEKRPTAVFTYDDDLAAELMHHLFEAGLRVPEDVSVTGFDDCWFSEYLRVPLTTMRVPQKEIAETLVGLLSDRMEGKRTDSPAPAQCRTFEGEFVVRASTAPPLRRPTL